MNGFGHHFCANSIIMKDEAESCGACGNVYMYVYIKTHDNELFIQVQVQVLFKKS